MYCMKISVGSCFLSWHIYFLYQCTIFVLEVMIEQTKNNVDVLFICLNLWQRVGTTLPEVTGHMYGQNIQSHDN